MTPRNTVHVRCSGCGTMNRAIVGKGARCGKCKRPFSDAELTTATLRSSVAQTFAPDARFQVQALDPDTYEEDEAAADAGCTHALLDRNVVIAYAKSAEVARRIQTALLKTEGVK